MMRSRLMAFGGVFLAALLSSPVWGAVPPQPGTINYVEGQASAGGQALTEKSVGTSKLAPNESLTTQDGRAEILLTPGIFLRLDKNSSVEMISPGLADTVVDLQRGRAMVEVAQIRKENNVRVNMANTSTQLLKPGLYNFNATQDLIQTFDGKAMVREDDRRVSVGGGHELDLTATGKNLKAQKFDKKASEDDFYRWASLRSSYLAQANVDAATRYVVGSGWEPGWYGTGWYWDPWFGAYTFIPANGMLWGPFGWGFYSPWVVYGAPVYHYGFGYSHHFGPAYRPPVVARGFHGGGFSGGRVGGFRAAPGGGFSGHSGGFGGGFHGGGFGGRR